MDNDIYKILLPVFKKSKLEESDHPTLAEASDIILEQNTGISEDLTKRDVFEFLLKKHLDFHITFEENKIKVEDYLKSIVSECIKKKTFKVYFTLGRGETSLDTFDIKLSNKFIIKKISKNAKITNITKPYYNGTVVELVSSHNVYLEVTTKGYFLTKLEVNLNSILKETLKESLFHLYILKTLRIFKIEEIPYLSPYKHKGIYIFDPDLNELSLLDDYKDLSNYLMNWQVINSSNFSNLSLVLKSTYKGLTDKDLQNLINASYWAFQSEAELNRNIMQAYIHLSIAFETIITMDGDNEETSGVTGKLLDRVSFSIGQSSTEREEIRKDLKSFYKVRSKIIHGKEKYMDEDKCNKELYFKTLTYFQRMLYKELKIDNTLKRLSEKSI